MALLALLTFAGCGENGDDMNNTTKTPGNTTEDNYNNGTDGDYNRNDDADKNLKDDAADNHNDGMTDNNADKNLPQKIKNQINLKGKINTLKKCQSINQIIMNKKKVQSLVKN